MQEFDLTAIDLLKVKTIVGGAPVTQAFADQIQADGYSDDAPGGVELVRKLLGV